MRSLIVVAAIAFSSCASSQNTAVKIPEDLLIRYAEGGGFTGQWTGAVIQANGSVRTWSPRSPDSLGSTLGTLSHASLARLWSMIEDRRLFEASATRESGNMTRSISIAGANNRVDASWPMGPAVSSSAQPFAAFYDECRRAVAGLKP